jgi:hypothetical protein
MPEEKNFKRRVRARVAETGERYTQARAELDVRAPGQAPPTPGENHWSQFEGDWMVRLRLGGPWRDFWDAMPRSTSLESIAALTPGGAPISTVSIHAVMSQRVDEGLTVEDLHGPNAPRLMSQRQAAYALVGSRLNPGLGRRWSERLWSGDPAPDTDPMRYRQHEVSYLIQASDDVPDVLALAEAQTELPWLLDLAVDIPTAAPDLERAMRDAPEQLRSAVRETGLPALPIRLVFASRLTDYDTSRGTHEALDPHDPGGRPRPAELLTTAEVAEHLKSSSVGVWEPAFAGTSEDGPFTAALYDVDDGLLNIVIYEMDADASAYTEYFRRRNSSENGRYQQLTSVADDAYVDRSVPAVCLRVGTVAAVLSVPGERTTDPDDLISLARLVATRLRKPQP